MAEEKTYTADAVKRMLDQSMEKFRSSMIELIQECAAHYKYKGLSGDEALRLVAEKLKGLK